MGYQVKWVKEKLGISRKALRNFERVGLMPPNKEGKYRNYSEEDINRIWNIRLLQGMGYSLKEIVEIFAEEKFDLKSSLEKKIKELEGEKENIERYLGYAQAIKTTGIFPKCPENMGMVTFEEFHEKALRRWNVNASAELKRCQTLSDFLLIESENESDHVEIEKFLEFSEIMKKRLSNVDMFMANKAYPLEILKRKDRGTTDPEVQLLVKMIYESRIEMLPEFNRMTKQQFAIFESSLYQNGDIARIEKYILGKDECKFLSDAIAVFGGL